MPNLNDAKAGNIPKPKYRAVIYKKQLTDKDRAEGRFAHNTLIEAIRKALAIPADQLQAQILHGLAAEQALLRCAKCNATEYICCCFETHVADSHRFVTRWSLPLYREKDHYRFLNYFNDRFPGLIINHEFRNTDNSQKVSVIYMDSILLAVNAAAIFKPAPAHNADAQVVDQKEVLLIPKRWEHVGADEKGMIDTLQEQLIQNIAVALGIEGKENIDRELRDDHGVAAEQAFLRAAGVASNILSARYFVTCISRDNHYFTHWSFTLPDKADHYRIVNWLEDRFPGLLLRNTFLPGMQLSSSVDVDTFKLFEQVKVIFKPSGQQNAAEAVADQKRAVAAAAPVVPQPAPAPANEAAIAQVSAAFAARLGDIMDRNLYIPLNAHLLNVVAGQNGSPIYGNGNAGAAPDDGKRLDVAPADQKRPAPVNAAVAAAVAALAPAAQPKPKEQAKPAIAAKLAELAALGKEPENIPEDFLCPLSLGLMLDPVILADEITYDREEVKKHFERNKDKNPIMSPSSQTPLEHNHVIANANLRSRIISYLEAEIAKAKQANAAAAPAPKGP